MAGNAFKLVVNFVFSLVLVARLNSAQLGLQGAIVSFANIVMALAFMGLFSISQRELTNRSPVKQQEIYRSIYSLSIVLSIVVCTGAAIVAWVLHSFPGEQFLILLLGMFTLIASYAPVIPTEALMVVRGEGWRAAFIESTIALIASIVGVIILLNGGSVGALYVAFSLLSVVEITWYAISARRYIEGGPRFVYRPKEWKYYLSQGMPSGLGTFFYVITGSAGIYLVYTFIKGGDVLAGYIYIAYSIILPLLRSYGFPTP